MQVSCQDQHVVVSVADTGPGISPEDTERIFEPFYQGSDRLWHDKGGSGLGLSISKRFVELHGGRKSRKHAGSWNVLRFHTACIPPCGAYRSTWAPDQERLGVAGARVRHGSAWLYGHARQATCRRLRRLGTLCSQFVHYSDEVKFIDAQDLDQATRDLHRCPAHAVVFNMATVENLWQAMEIRQT